MRPASTSSSTAAGSFWWSRLRRAALADCSTACAGACHLHHWSKAMAEPLLRVEQVSKRFGGLLAVDRASFGAQAGRITALIGPNGAGKTTLFSIIAGSLQPSQGRILYDGATITGEPPYRLSPRGLARPLP